MGVHIFCARWHPFFVPYDYPVFMQRFNFWVACLFSCRVTTLFYATFQLVDGFTLVLQIFKQLSK